MLHDQSIVAGIGNIYSDGILCLCSIYPETECTELIVGEALLLPEVSESSMKNKMQF